MKKFLTFSLLFLLIISAPIFAQLQIRKIFTAYGSDVIDTTAIVSGTTEEGKFGRIFVSGNPESNGLGLYVFDIEFRLTGFTPITADSVSVDLRHLQFPLFPNGTVTVAFLNNDRQVGSCIIDVDSLDSAWKRFSGSLPNSVSVDAVSFIFSSSQIAPFFALFDIGLDNIRIQKGSGWMLVTDFGNITVNVEENKVPNEFILYQNYPNPFNPTTKITFSLPKAGDVSLKVHDILGREVLVLADHKFFDAGTHIIEFNGSNLASGMYVYVLHAGDFVQTKKMLLMK